MCQKLKYKCQILRKRQKWSELQVIVAEKHPGARFAQAKIGAFLAAWRAPHGLVNENREAIGRVPVKEIACTLMAVLTKNIMT